MYDVSGDFLMTYDPDYTERHSDSSDFEGSCSPPITPKNGNHNLVKKKVSSKSKKELTPESCNSRANTVTTDCSSKEMWESQTIISQNGREIDLEVRQNYRNRKSKILDSGDQIETIKSKRSLIRHKVIPCISSMFGRSGNNVKQMSIIKENQVENVQIDNSCQAGHVSGGHKMRKHNRRQQYYAVQPVYNVEGNVHAKSIPFQHAKIIREPLLTCKMVGNEYSNLNYSLTSSSEGTEPPRYISKKKKGKKSKNTVDAAMGNDYANYEGPNLKTRNQQSPSKHGRKIPYQVYTTPYQYQQTETGCSPVASNKFSGSELPSTCSGFWDYLINKINTKYQGQAGGMFRPCKCNSPNANFAGCTPHICENSAFSQEPNALLCNGPNKPTTESCSCNTSPIPQSPMNLPEHTPQQRPPPNPPPLKTKQGPHEKVECKCYPDRKPAPPQLPQLPTTAPKMPPTPRSSPPFQTPDDATRPCQLPHEDITGTLTQKYNGEILCIHNPPCVLINGCLNLPPPKEEMSMDLWPVTQGKSGYNNFFTRKSEKKQVEQGAQYGPQSHDMHQCQIIDRSCQYFPPPAKQLPEFGITDEGCQYHIPSLEMKQLMITDQSCQYRVSVPVETPRKENSYEGCQYIPQLIDMQQLTTSQQKQEKIIQSICNHNPPCEVVRTCCKPKFDPKLQNSCVHVPMCQKVPMCLMELKTQNEASCQHKPKCAEVPICTRNYIVLTAKEEVATQVRPKTKMVCRHEPPCIMIPKCLARICDSYIPCDAIPDCVHQPMCEMIPACCRKSAKEMVSVCSQYPNQCCIV